MSDVFSKPDPVKTQVTAADLVGEGKKFKTVDDLASAKFEADQFIEQLKAETKGLREGLSKASNADENLAALQARIAELEAKLKPSQEPKVDTTPALTPEKLEELVSGFITKREQTQTANQNIALANEVLVKQYGGLDKAQEAFHRRASETGLAIADLKALAAKSPTAFFHVMGVDPDKKVEAKTDLLKSTTNTINLSPTGLKPGTAAYYNAKRKEMGNAKFFADVKLQQEIYKAKKDGTYDA